MNYFFDYKLNSFVESFLKSMKVFPLSEGSFTIDQTKQFIPFNKEADDLQQRTVGSLLVEIQPFVVITKRDIILLDCGLGYTNQQGVLQLHQNLIDIGIDPLSVTKVLMSHLHKDHAGGIGKRDDVLGRSFLSFPNATYYINQQEMEFAMKGSSASYLPEKLQVLYHSDNVVLINNEGAIDNYITYSHTGAHSPFHQVFWIEEDGEKIFFGADEAPQLRQMKSKFVAKYDFDGKKSMQLRLNWWERGNSEHWTMLFYHDIKTPTVSL